MDKKFSFFRFLLQKNFSAKTLKKHFNIAPKKEKKEGN